MTGDESPGAARQMLDSRPTLFNACQRDGGQFLHSNTVVMQDLALSPLPGRSRLSSISYFTGTAPFATITFSPAALRTNSRKFETAGVGGVLTTRKESRVSV